MGVQTYFLHGNKEAQELSIDWDAADWTNWSQRWHFEQERPASLVKFAEEFHIGKFFGYHNLEDVAALNKMNHSFHVTDMMTTNVPRLYFYVPDYKQFVLYCLEFDSQDVFAATLNVAESSIDAHVNLERKKAKKTAKANVDGHCQVDEGEHQEQHDQGEEDQEHQWQEAYLSQFAETFETERRKQESEKRKLSSCADWEVRKFADMVAADSSMIEQVKTMNPMMQRALIAQMFGGR